MHNVDPLSAQFFRLACYFEASLALVALFLGWLADINPFAHLRFDEGALANGILLTLPLILLFLAMRQSPYGPFRKIRHLLQTTLGARLQQRHWSDLLVLAAIAGFSEELLFRGTVQPWLEALGGDSAGLLLSNALFALAHAITPLYTLLAMLMGLYLSLSQDYGGERQLLTPIVIHTLYDFAAFRVILNDYRNRHIQDE